METPGLPRPASERQAAGRLAFQRRRLLGALLAAAVPKAVRSNEREAAVPLLMRISTENVETHFQTRFVQRFVDEVRRRTRGRLEVDFRHSARLFRDQDVVRALSEGHVEMAAPGNWQLERYDPSVSALTLPMFQGLSTEEHHRLRDGRMGQVISAHLAAALEVEVLGRWLDLGLAHVFTASRRVLRHEDMAKLRIRIAGGLAIASQLSALGAEPVVVAWPDLIQVLAKGRLDGVLTTFETVASARLWLHGLRYATECRAYFAQYIPIVSRRFWQRLTPELQLILRNTWDELVDQGRVEAALAQRTAKSRLQAEGVEVIEPSPEVLLAWRNQVVRAQPSLIRELGVPEALLREAGRGPP